MYLNSSITLHQHYFSQYVQANSQHSEIQKNDKSNRPMYKYVKEGGGKLSTINSVHRRGAQIPGARLARQLNFVQWCPVFIGP